ncbi:MAG TPA: helix-turn-helix transcriptional regulator [Anaerolineae bacterium]|nr:helix-turn-helix transcriptional regulator [Anaerolineae bacterium]
MRTLAEWLQEQLQARGMTQQAAAVYAGVSGATVSEMIKRGHVPKMEILFRLADYFETPREYVLALATRMPIEGSAPVTDRGLLVQELLEEFRKVPDEWKEVAIQQVELVARMTAQPTVRLEGEDTPVADPVLTGTEEEGEDEGTEAS